MTNWPLKMQQFRNTIRRQPEQSHSSGRKRVKRMRVAVEQLWFASYRPSFSQCLSLSLSPFCFIVIHSLSLFLFLIAWKSLQTNMHVQCESKKGWHWMIAWCYKIPTRILGVFTDWLIDWFDNLTVKMGNITSNNVGPVGWSFVVTAVIAAAARRDPIWDQSAV